MSKPEDPTPLTGAQLTGVERVIALSDAALAEAARAPSGRTRATIEHDRAGAIEEILLRLGIAETRAIAAEEAGAIARGECRELRQQLFALGVRVERVEGRVGVLERAVKAIEDAVAAIKANVAAIASDVGVLQIAMLKFSGLTIAGGAIANVVMHKLGWM